jgi:hypothetical protein
MNGTEITRSYQDQFAQQILRQPDHRPSYSPLPISRPLAKALLQKAIRRGEEQLAQRAAATCESACKKGSDSLSMKFAGGLAVLQWGDQRHADRTSNFVPCTEWVGG